MKKEKIRLNFLQRFIIIYAGISTLPIGNILVQGTSNVNTEYYDAHLILFHVAPFIFGLITLPVFYLINQIDYKPNFFSPDVYDKRIKAFKLIMNILVWVFIYRASMVMLFGVPFWSFAGETAVVKFFLHELYYVDLTQIQMSFKRSDPSAMFGSMFAFTIIWPITLLVGMFTLVLMKNRSLRNDNRRTA